MRRIDSNRSPRPEIPPLFSVVIQTLDRPEGLSRLLRSLAKVEHPSGQYEIIVVNDGGTTLQHSVLNDLVRPIPLKLINQANAGVMLSEAIVTMAGHRPVSGNQMTSK